MDGEMMSFIKVWIWAISSLTYCYLISFNLPKGIFRLFSLLPVLCLLTILPLNLNSIILGGFTTFFLTWLANFKLLLFAFDKGPLSANPSISYSHFISVACFPIKLKNHDTPNRQIISRMSTIIKLILLVLLILASGHKQHLHPTLLAAYFCGYMYLLAELGLALVAYLIQTLLGAELEPQFNNPYLSTSLQDFWGRRWNLMVTTILRPTVYEPLMRFTWLMGAEGVRAVAVLGTFIVSGLMHELVFYYLRRVRPSWEVTCFFVVHGVLVVLEIIVKRKLKARWGLHPILSCLITVGILVGTADWWFFPPLLRCKADEKVRSEIIGMLSYISL